MKRPTLGFMGDDCDPDHDSIEFRFGEGGLLRRIESACHLTQPRAQVMFAILFTWIPIVLLGSYSEIFQGRHEPILHDVGMHVRLLVATPIFLVLDYVFPLVCRTALVQLSKKSFIREEERARFDALWRGGTRRADSPIPEALIALASIGLGVAVVFDVVQLRGLPEGRSLTAAQTWFALTDLPLFQFLLWRSVWRWLLWGRILIGLSRFDLALVPTHPDRRAGIAFLRRPSLGYCGSLLFATSSVVVAEWGERFVLGETLDSFKPLLALFAVIGLLFAFGPLLLFVPMLFRARYLGTIEASSFATRFARRFATRQAELGPGRELMASRELQGLTALCVTYRETVEEMKLLLIYKKDVVVLLAATLAPLLPLALVSVPQEEWERLVGLVTGTALP